MENQDEKLNFRMPLINEKAPDFQANTTDGERSLKDYEGKWLILFSHPADFTPVCSTEFMGFADLYDELQSINTELLGLSIDSVFSHIAWKRSLKEKFGKDIPFPIIDDLSMNVAHAYGMIHPGASDTSAVRSTFIIDPKGILRALVYYPMSNGRSMKEFLRIVKAMQATDENGMATPEGWEPGDSFIVPPPKTSKEAIARMESDYNVTDWYFSKTK